MRYVLDALKMKTKTEAHSYLKEVLRLPEYYGGNLDALYDCLTEMEDVEVEINTDAKTLGAIMQPSVCLCRAVFDLCRYGKFKTGGKTHLCKAAEQLQIYAHRYTQLDRCADICITFKNRFCGDV